MRVERVDGVQAPATQTASLHAAATDFEGLLIRQLAATLVATAKPEGEDGDAAAGSAYLDMLPDALADAVADAGGLGLAKELEEGR